jgi:hypothetical protein
MRNGGGGAQPFAQEPLRKKKKTTIQNYQLERFPEKKKLARKKTGNTLKVEDAESDPGFMGCTTAACT